MLGIIISIIIILTYNLIIYFGIKDIIKDRDIVIYEKGEIENELKKTK